MFSHIVLGSDDIPATRKFYDAALAPLGHAAGSETPDGSRLVYYAQTGILMITRPLNGEPATYANGGTVGFAAPDPAAVDAFHAAGLAAGGTDEGAPGSRPAISGSYAAYLRDPTGNKIVAWCVKQDS
ncbi:VOC family protein [Haliea sp. E17]|uniref:VOC family protein n=1 Tax=Haliea sp. E17 TaxID=3401576 RepID=UPI003AB02227